MKLVTPTNLVIITATQSTREKFEENSPLYASSVRLGIPLLVKYENTQGISTVYNEMIAKLIQDAENQFANIEYIIFAHDDVRICDAFIFEKLTWCFIEKRFDLVGLAGATTVNLSDKGRVAWHSIGDKSKLSGAVSHPSIEGGTVDASQWYVNCWGLAPARVITLDGLFLATRKSLLKQNPELRFDPTFTFDFYDMDFCMSFYLKGLTAGTTNVFAEHYSHGAGINSERYAMLQQKFLAKWRPKFK